MKNTASLVTINNLTITVGKGGKAIVSDVSFDIAPGEFVGIVGESGSGKTQAARAIMGLTPSPLVTAAGSIKFSGLEITTASTKALRQLRGARIGMVFQEPMTSLNPSMKIGAQLDEGLTQHRKDLSRHAREALILAMLKRVGIKDPASAIHAWPHEFSGGMRQRIMLAAVMLLEPDLLIADEPTTALDAVVQRDVLELMVSLTKEHNTAVLMISHDLPMVARYTSRIIVMRHGVVVERGHTTELLAAPQHAYTKKLLSAMPFRPPARTLAASKPLVQVKDLEVTYKGKKRFFGKAERFPALKGISLDIHPGEVVAIVGGSGSGKTTLGRTIAGLLSPDSGTLLFNGQPISKHSPDWQNYRLNCQMVFQDPYSSLNPRMTIGQLVAEGLRHCPELTPQERQQRTLDVMEEVGLEHRFATHYPHELSGGQRQRVAIARAIVRRPSFVIADEPVSALDVTVQAQVLRLFAELQQKYGFSCLFISHDLGVVEQVADRVIVMHQGAIIEEGSRDTIFDTPQNEYTRTLLSAIPSLIPTDTGGVQLKWRLNS